jgi:hypothetical protein
MNNNVYAIPKERGVAIINSATVNLEVGGMNHHYERRDKKNIFCGSCLFGAGSRSDLLSNASGCTIHSWRKGTLGVRHQ